MAKTKRKTKSKTKARGKGKAQTKTRGRGKKKRGFLGAITAEVKKKPSFSQTAVQAAMAGGSLIAGLVAGLAAGKYSLYTGAVVTGLGVLIRKPYLSVAGLAMAVTPNVKSTSSTGVSTTQTSDATVSGFDVKQIATDAKDRITGYFKGFTEKLTFKPQSGMSGLNGDEPVTYFVNPYASRELRPGSLDMSALDRVQEQIAMMNSGNGTSGFDEDISMRNF